MTLVNPDLIKEIKKYSTKDFNISACFNCGNCTAICPLSDEEDPFPRRLIRFAQVGLKEKILGSDQMWLCSYCNDCSDTCPRDAEPGEFVMATRRWAMGQYDVTRISQLLQKSRWGGFLAIGLIFVFSLILFYLFSTPLNTPLERPIRLFDLVSKETVEIVGISLAAIVIVIIGLSILNMYRLISKEYNSNLTDGIKTAYKTRLKDKKLNTSYHLIFSPFIMTKQAFFVLIKEVFGQYRQLECALPPHKPEFKSQFIRSRWFMHLFILWGFFGLGLSTALNMFLKPDPNVLVPITHPIRILGIISGISLMIGISIAFWNRLKKTSRYSSHSLTCDWIFLVHLFLVGLTGFLVTINVYITAIPPMWGYLFFVAHIIVVIELILLAPFGKFSHVWYRSFALWIHYGLHARQNKLEKEVKKAKMKSKEAKAKTAPIA
ncbi:MAG: 4Fe-4S dicluster domain-containing protein [Promethearchaeota archaeon]